LHKPKYWTELTLHKPNTCPKKITIFEFGKSVRISI
jgi:hypothetical protein